MNYIDIAVLAIVLLLAVIGLWKGFFKSLISFLGFAVSFIAAAFLCQVVAEALLDVDMFKKLIVGESGSVYTWILSMMPEKLKNTPAAQLSTLTEEGIWSYLLLPFKSILSNGLPAHVSVGQGLALCLAQGVFIAMTAVALFIIIRLLMFIVTTFLKSLVDGRPGIFNRLLGAVMGGARGFSWVVVIFFIMSFFIGFTFMAQPKAKLDESTIGKPVYEAVVKIKDKYFTGGDDIFDKLLIIAGLKTPPSDELNEIEQNLVSELKRIHNGQDDFTPINPDEFKDTGYYDIIMAIVDYNTAAAQKIEARQTDLSFGAMQNYLDALEEEESPRDAFFGFYNLLTEIKTLTDENEIIDCTARIKTTLKYLQEQYEEKLLDDFGELKLPNIISGDEVSCYYNFKTYAYYDISTYQACDNAELYTALEVICDYFIDAMQTVQNGEVNQSGLNLTKSFLLIFEGKYTDLLFKMETYMNSSMVSEIVKLERLNDVILALEDIAELTKAVKAYYGELVFEIQVITA